MFLTDILEGAGCGCMHMHNQPPTRHSSEINHIWDGVENIRKVAGGVQPLRNTKNQRENPIFFDFLIGHIEIGNRVKNVCRTIIGLKEAAIKTNNIFD